MRLRSLFSAALGSALLLVSSPALADVLAFDVGPEHGCALDGCGEIQCWGYNGFFGELDGMSGDFVDLAVGTDHNCALESSGVAVCWGRSDDERLEPPVEDFVDLEAGSAFSCGIRDNGEVVCWGRESAGPDAPAMHASLAGPPLGKQYREVSLGDDSGCAITSGRSSLYCWGPNVPAGVRKLAASDLMQSVGERFETVSVGARHLCVVSTDDRVYCMGDDKLGQLMPDHPFDDDPGRPGTPVGESFMPALDESIVDGEQGLLAVVWGGASQIRVLDVSVTRLGTCGLVKSGAGAPIVYCWGFPFQYGHGRTPLPGSSPDEVLLGGHQFCGWTHGGDVECAWEFPAYAQMPERQVPDLSCGA